MEETELGMIISFSDLQEKKALFPIDKTESGMKICVSELQPAKDPSPMEVHSLPMLTVSSLLQLEKA